MTGNSGEATFTGLPESAGTSQSASPASYTRLVPSDDQTGAVAPFVPGI